MEVKTDPTPLCFHIFIMPGLNSFKHKGSQSTSQRYSKDLMSFSLLFLTSHPDIYFMYPRLRALISYKIYFVDLIL